VVWLTSQSLWVLVVGCLVIAALIAVGSRLAARAIVPMSERENAHAIVAPLRPALGAAFAILAALTLVNEAGYLTSAQEIVGTEAGDASRLAWAATIRGVRGAPIQAALARYLQATRTFEWHGSSAANGIDAQTDQALADLERVVRARADRPVLGTPTSTELLAALTSDRRSRLAAASREPPGLYVITLAVAGIALIANASVLTLRSRARVASLIGGLTAVIGLSMALLFALGTPWRGSITVSGSPIDAVVRNVSAGHFHA
jgi:hypothetical protein